MKILLGVGGRRLNYFVINLFDKFNSQLRKCIDSIPYLSLGEQ